MNVNIPSSSKVNTDKNTLIEYVEDDVDELPDSDISKSDAIVFDKIDIDKFGVLKLSKFVDMIQTLGEVFHSDDMAGHLHKVDPN